MIVVDPNVEDHPNLESFVSRTATQDKPYTLETYRIQKDIQVDDNLIRDKIIPTKSRNEYAAVVISEISPSRDAVGSYTDINKILDVSENDTPEGIEKRVDNFLITQ